MKDYRKIPFLYRVPVSQGSPIIIAAPEGLGFKRFAVGATSTAFRITLGTTDDVNHCISFGHAAAIYNIDLPDVVPQHLCIVGTGAPMAVNIVVYEYGSNVDDEAFVYPSTQSLQFIPRETMQMTDDETIVSRETIEKRSE